MADLSEIRTTLVQMARVAVGDLLSTMPGPGGTTKPAVIKSKKGALELTPPFIVLYTGPTREQGLDKAMYQSVNENGYIEYEEHYDQMFSYVVHGGDASEIARKLHKSFKHESFRYPLNDLNIGVLETSQIIPSDDKWAGEYIEMASFDIVLSIGDKDEIQDEGYFDSFTIDGELYEGIDDPDPLTINIEV